MKKMYLLAAALVLAGCSQAGLFDASEAQAVSRGISDPVVQLMSARTNVRNSYSQGYEGYLSGDIELENLAYAKQVKVVYNVGSGWQEATAYFVKPLGNNREHWAFGISLGMRTNTGDPRGGYRGPAFVTQFAIKYTVNGKTYWDNNGGYNVDYRVASDGVNSQGYPPVAFGKDKVKVQYATYTDYPNTYFRGYVGFKKLGTNRKVTVVYTMDNWETVWTVDAIASLGTDYGDTAVYYFNDYANYEKYGSFPSPYATYEFAVAYEVDGVTYWDNNVSSNYTVEAGLNVPNY